MSILTLEGNWTTVESSAALGGSYFSDQGMLDSKGAAWITYVPSTETDGDNTNTSEGSPGATVNVSGAKPQCQQSSPPSSYVGFYPPTGIARQHPPAR